MDVPKRDCQKCGRQQVVETRRGPATCHACQKLPRNHWSKWYQTHKDEARKYKREAMRRYRQEFPERYAIQSRNAKRKIKAELLRLYGAQCTLCGFSDKRALTLDHKNNDGAEERKRMSQFGMYRQAIKHYQPERYRILCMNCQFITRFESGKHNQYWQSFYGELHDEPVGT